MFNSCYGTGGNFMRPSLSKGGETMRVKVRSV